MPEKTVDAVRLCAVSRSFKEGSVEHIVLRDVDAVFRTGEIVAIRGRSGSGKSTLLNLISGIDTPDTGTVEVNGQNLTGMNEKRRTLFRRESIGFVYQAFNLVPTLSVADNIRLVLELNNVAPNAAASRIDDLLTRVGLADRAGSYPDVLSGGEQQRVAIARALAHDPSIILADEPTGNLDEKTAASVLELLTGLVRARGSTLLMATHSETIAASCDRRFEVRDGGLHDQDGVPGSSASVGS
ncbi:MAG: ABC transporter ATP-binding protein [Pseudomonadota bacterium]